MTDRPFLPTHPAVIDTARMTGHTPEYVADAMNSPLAADVGHSVKATVVKDEIEAACDALIDRVMPGFGEAITAAMLEGYKLGFRHGVRSLAAVDPLSGLMDVVRRTYSATSPPPDVRPHVPHVDPHADDRLHLIADGITACGQQSPQRGTHEVGEQDCAECTDALRRAAHTFVQQRADVGRNEAEAPSLVKAAAEAAAEAAAVGDLGPAEALARRMHPGAFDDEELTVSTIVAGAVSHGDLIDMTAEVFAYAQAHKLRMWQCRHCARGRVMGHYRDVTAQEEGDDCLAHEAHCEHNPNLTPGTLVEGRTADA
jgi:hypothetical protein